jgi:SP family xylose:H+ symportor-like MFS transporter
MLCWYHFLTPIPVGIVHLSVCWSTPPALAMSWGPVCWVLLPKIFPNSIRSTVMSIAVAGQWVANFLVSWTFPMLDKNQYLTDNFNHGVSYWIYGVMGLLAAFFIWKMVPETKGKTLEEMEKYWKR